MAKKTKARKNFNNHIVAITTESYGIETEIFASDAVLMKAIREGEFTPSERTRFFSMGSELRYEMSFTHVPVTKRVVNLKSVSK